jgi:hypothetical protein
MSSDHPSNNEKTIEEWLGSDLSKAFDGVEIQWVLPEDNDGQTGLVAVHLATPNGVVRLD